MFPIRDPAGRTVAFGGRVLPGAATNAGKYVNSAESPLFAKNRVVFALDVARSAIVERDAAVVMEGYADCIMAHQFGITNAVATLGTALTENHVSALKRFTRKVILVFDGDKAGKDAAEKSLPRFLSQDVDLRILTLTSEKDPADFLIAQGAEPFQKLLETAVEAWEYKLRLLIERNGLDSVDAREQVVTEMLELFRHAPGFGGSARENIVLNRLAFRVGPIGVANSRDVRRQPPQGEPGGRVERAVESCGGADRNKRESGGRERGCERELAPKQNWKASCSRSCSSIRRPSTCCGLRLPSTTSNTNTTGDCWRSVIDSLRRGSSLRMTT